MDDNTFALFVLALGTLLLCVLIWQIFAVARARMQASAVLEQQEQATQLIEHQQQLDQRVTSLAGDVHALARRVSELETECGEP